MEVDSAQGIASPSPFPLADESKAAWSDEITPEIQLAVDDFRNFLENAIPVFIAHPDLREYVIREANFRLEQARQEGVALQDVFIGEDCLPTWPGMCWDPVAESLHCVLQSRLMDYQASKDLGQAMREDIIRKGNRRLQEALANGLTLEDITFGDRLLPVWNKKTLIMDETASSPQEAQGSATQNHNDSSSDADTFEDHSSTFDESEGTSAAETAFDTSGSNHQEPEDLSDGSDDSDSDDSSVDDTILMHNFVGTQPEYLDPEDPVNIVHGAQIVDLGVEGQETEVDIEVYVIEEEDEDIIAELHEVELGISREEFEYHFDTTEAVDIEIPGTDIRFHRPSSETRPASEIRVISAIMFDPTPTIEEPDSEEDDEEDEDGDNTNTVVFEETEYGFRW